MPNSTGTPILIAAGAVASILIAFSGRRATRKTVVVRKRRRREAGRLPQNGVAPHNAPTTLDGALAEESNQTSRQSSRSAIPLLLHGLISIGLVFCASHWHPTIINDVESWRQLVGSILIAILTVHASIFYLVPSRPPRVVLAPPPPLITARPETIEALNGVWIKDKQASDSMDAVCDLMKMNGLLRMAIGLIKGVEILAIPGEDFKLDVLSGVLWFKIKEKYKLTGEEARHRRRDLRGGGSFGVAAPAPDGGVQIRNRFNRPLAGTMVERLHCPELDVLQVDTVVHVPERGAPLIYRQIYRKKAA